MTHKLSISYKGLCEIRTKIESLEDVNSLYQRDDILRDISIILSKAETIQCLTDEKVMISLNEDITNKIYLLVTSSSLWKNLL